ncbi:hypothetical protein [uncultured Nonlabens sp.]|uniref:hypothetical protein n=1 Tax=uncultured Nonlabens sp. TaxID=859306 RepID=UPI0026340651|nr:hypothetical protein [uncultured Nonlabens sp.]
MKKSVLNKFCEFEKKGGVFPLLPASFKYIGTYVSISAIVGLLLVYYLGDELRDFYKEVCMHFVLIGLFLLVLSRDKNEDERTNQLRYRAFAFAFVLGTGMLLILPFIHMLLHGFYQDILEWEYQSFFFIMASYLFYYLMYFNIFKKQL